MINDLLQKYTAMTWKRIMSPTSPILYFTLAALILLPVLSVGNNNENLFFWMFNFTGSSIFLDTLLSFCAQYLIFGIAAITVFWVIFQRKNILPILLMFCLIGAISFLLSRITTHIILDPRPYILYHLTPLVSVAKDNGFPSDHMLLATLCAVVVSLYRKQLGWILFLCALFVGIGRVYVAAHHPLDVVGGMAIVLASGILFVLGIHDFRLNMHDEKKHA